MERKFTVYTATISSLLQSYLSREITRQELTDRAKEIKESLTKESSCVDYGSYIFLYIDRVLATLAETPEMSYQDKQIKEVLEIIQSKAFFTFSFMYVFSSELLDENDIKFVNVAEGFAANYRSGKMFRIKKAVTMSDGRTCYYDIDAYINQQDYEFLAQVYDALLTYSDEKVVDTAKRGILTLMNSISPYWLGTTSYFGASGKETPEFWVNTMEKYIAILRGKHPALVHANGTLNCLGAMII